MKARPWQLRMFQKTLKKKLRLRVFERLIGTLPPQAQCLLVTCGDNNGAINYHLRQLGGTWHWADLEETSLEEMAELLESEVRFARFDAIPFEDEMFDCVVAIDAHEHIDDPQVFTNELQRVAKKGARIFVTVPGGDSSKLVNRLKQKLGMTRERYGHVRDGFGADEVERLMRTAGIEPTLGTSFSKFFTEIIELTINFLYVRVLAHRNNGTERPSSIAPQTREQLNSVEKTYRLYAAIYPVIWLFSQLDGLLFFTDGYVVVVAGRRT